jgi:hypothetical protein
MPKNPKQPAEPPPTTPPPPNAVDVADELLLERLDQMRKTAELVTKELTAIRASLPAAEKGRHEESEGALREALSRAEREWSETAVRFRALADDLIRQIGRIDRQRAGSVTWLLPLLGAIFGGMLVGGIALWASHASPGAPAASVGQTKPGR